MYLCDHGVDESRGDVSTYPLNRCRLYRSARLWHEDIVLPTHCLAVVKGQYSLINGVEALVRALAV